jgi:hypothetical protein
MRLKKDNDSKVKRKKDHNHNRGEERNHLGSRNGLIHFTLILMGKIVSGYEQAYRNGLSS